MNVKFRFAQTDMESLYHQIDLSKIDLQDIERQVFNVDEKHVGIFKDEPEVQLDSLYNEEVCKVSALFMKDIFCK